VAILVVDDDAGLLRALRRVLVSHGFEVEVAAGGTEALARLRARTIAIGALAGLLPAVRAARLAPTDALRTL
jgi:DNA-binding response OmpR family regulator